MITLELKDIVKQYPNNPEPSVKDFNLKIEPGEMIAFLGPSGCGKTTTLKMIAGLETPTEGDILINGESIVSIPPEKREISMVFQKSLLFPNMTVEENVAFGLKMRKVDKKERLEKANTLLERVRLDGYGKRLPTQLSGGQEQRISLARGLAVNPRVFLLDEPLSALDAELRIEMRTLIKSMQREMNVTTIFVTHDQEEAVMLADKVALMFDGKLQQFDTPEKFYEQPKSKRIADFFGCPNFIEGEQKGKTVHTEFGTFELSQLLKEEDRKVLLPMRAECVELSDEKDAMKGLVKVRIFMGLNVRYIVDGKGHEYHIMLDSATKFVEGDTISFKPQVDRLWAVPYEE